MRHVRRGLHGQVVESVARRVLAGEFAEGATIDVAALEREYGVSLTVLREAVRVLSAKGLLDARQKRGTFVRPRAEWHLLDPDVIRWQFENPDKALFDNLAELRGIIEPAAARFAAQRRTKAELEALETALEDMESAAGDPGAMVEADLRFHRALLAATHNELLARMEVVLVTGLAERDRIVHGIDHTDDPTPAHAAVSEAIEAGDPTVAEQAMRDLLDKARRDMERVRRRRRRSA